MMLTAKQKSHSNLISLVGLCCLVVGLCTAAGVRGETLSVASTPVIDIFFLPSGPGWIVLSDKQREFLFRTDDGNQWSKIPLDFRIEKIFFLNHLDGWGIASEDQDYLLVATTDGGKSWRLACRLPELGKKTIVTGMLFVDHDNGWIIGSQSKGLSVVLRITDGNSAKTVPSLSGKFGLSRAIFGVGNSGHVWIIGDDSVLHSDDAGRTWARQIGGTNLPGRRKAISFTAGWAFEDGRIYLVGQSAGAVLFQSTDFGERWTLASESEEAKSFTDLQFWDEKHGCAVGFSSLLYCTKDGGDTWQAQSALPKSEKHLPFMDNIFERIVFLYGGTRGWVVADGGYLFQTADGGNSWRKLDPFTTTAGGAALTYK
jgi:photosystem II stability/assembly factor-like uncharacterized protein